ncbi:hypothetical protein RB3741 [Rhodopirellula baltica SH 1]|uniref:Uncharacterized protein n=1 Tax=Rhodopirellula baltica (strain DSM 10527 / NCIMB 13988 / SH1) TaxID=243090 RepID=Q7UTQ6_RHOBA|nr:hypothetical protein RB3741 [Rhodopirellula baltica SH 1]
MMLSRRGQPVGCRSVGMTLDVKRMALRPPQPWNAFLRRALAATPNSLRRWDFLRQLPAQPEQSAELVMEGSQTLRYHAGDRRDISASSNQSIQLNSETFWRTFL